MLPKQCPVCKYPTLVYDQNYAVCSRCHAYMKPLKWHQKPLVWSRERSLWAWRIPLIIWFGLILLDSLRDPSHIMNRLANPFYALNFGIHELGHVLFTVFGDFMRILGGSLFQCLFPLLWLGAFLQKKWYFAASLCLSWLGINLFDVSVYVADARARLLPLATGFAGLSEQGNDEFYDQAHDWYQILSRTGHLESDLALARGMRVAASTVFVIGLIIATILVVNMFIGYMQRRSLSDAPRV
jgi:hypothetical protein